MRLPQYTILIGIDAGTNTGLCVYDRVLKKIIRCETLMIHQAFPLVSCWKGEKVLVIVEDARQVKFGTDKFKAQGAGSVKRDAKIWEDFLKDHKIPYEMVRPNKRITKWSAGMFEKVTGWKERTSSHARDAALLVWGR